MAGCSVPGGGMKPKVRNVSSAAASHAWATPGNAVSARRAELAASRWPSAGWGSAGVGGEDGGRVTRGQAASQIDSRGTAVAIFRVGGGLGRGGEGDRSVGDVGPGGIVGARPVCRKVEPTKAEGSVFVD